MVSKATLKLVAIFFTANLPLPISTAWAENPRDSTCATSKMPHVLMRLVPELSTGKAKAQTLQELSAFMKAHPEDSFSHYLLARYYTAQGMSQIGADELEKAWRLSPSDIGNLFVLLKYLKAGEEMERFSALLDEAFKVLDQDGLALGKIGALLAINSEYDQAERFLDKALKLAPGNPDILAERAHLKLLKRKFDQVLADTDKLLDLPSKAYLANYLRAQALVGIKKDEEALPYFRQAFKLNVNVPELNEQYFWCLSRLGRSKESLLPGLLAAGGFDSSYARSRSIVQRLCQDATKSTTLSDVAKATEEAKTLGLAHRTRSGALAAAAQIHNQKGDRRKALELLALASNIDSSAETLLRLARLEEEDSAHWPSAIESYKQVLALDPEQIELKAKITRLESRLPARQNDLALRLKDSLFR